ncbi:MAG: hypothetical protein V3575_06435, partial [Candidatus Absconditabacteria bacterium]
NNITKIGDFSDFYQYRLLSVTGNSKQVGYKQEQFKKTQSGFDYRFKIVFSLEELSKISGILNMRGEIYFDTLGLISSFNLLVMDSFLISGERGENENKILVSIKQIPESPSSFKQTKLYDIADLKFDLFVIKSLPFQNLQENQNYKFTYITPSLDISGTKLKKVDINIQKIDDFKYTVEQRVFGQNLKTKLQFDESGKLLSESNSIINSRLVKSENEIKGIIEYFDKTKNVPNKDENKNKEGEKETVFESNPDSLTGSSVQNNLSNMNIKEIVEQINSEILKTCPLLPINNTNDGNQ